MSKLLSKKQVKTAQDLENERLIKRGLTIGHAVDKLELKYKQTKEKYDKMIIQKEEQLNKTIFRLQKEITVLENKKELLTQPKQLKNA